MEANSKVLRERMRLLERRIGALQESEMSCCGVTMAQCHALVEIGRSPGLSLGQLAQLLELDTSTTSRTVNNLVKNGLVCRQADQEDRRFIAIELTPQGTAQWQKIETDMYGYYEKIFRRIPLEKREQVVESLTLLLASIDSAQCC